MSSDTSSSPAAWRLQTLTIPSLPAGINPFDAMRQVEYFYATEPNKDLAAARAGDYLEGLLPAGRRISVTKRSAFETEFVARLRSGPPVPVPARVADERRYQPDRIRVDRGEYVRAGGDATCEVCGCAYRHHAPVQGYPIFYRACDGRLLKL
jgi:hypothetical protein